MAAELLFQFGLHALDLSFCSQLSDTPFEAGHLFIPQLWVIDFDILWMCQAGRCSGLMSDIATENGPFWRCISYFQAGDFNCYVSSLEGTPIRIPKHRAPNHQFGPGKSSKAHPRSLLRELRLSPGLRVGKAIFLTWDTFWYFSLASNTYQNHLI